MDELESTSSTSCKEAGIAPRFGPVVAAASTSGRDRISMGASVRLWSVEAVAQDLGIPYDHATGLLDTLGLCLLKLPGTEKRYVNLYWLESALFNLTTPMPFVQTPDGAMDAGLVRLHQELAGCIYLAASKEAVRERVRKLARQMGKAFLTPPKKPPIIKQPKFREEDYRSAV